MSEYTNNKKGTELNDNELNDVNGGQRLHKSSSQMRVIDDQLNGNGYIRRHHEDDADNFVIRKKVPKEDHGIQS